MVDDLSQAKVFGNGYDDEMVGFAVGEVLL